MSHTHVLVLSFGWLAHVLRTGSMAWEEIEASNALFFFNACRVHLFGQEMPDEVTDKGDWKRLQRILANADAEGRVAWRPFTDDVSYQTMGTFFALLGENRVPVSTTALQRALVGKLACEHDSAGAYNPLVDSVVFREKSFSTWDYQVVAEALRTLAPTVKVIADDRT